MIYHKSGSIITIPKEAFLDESGNVITSPVDLKFRMFTNPLEIYLARNSYEFHQFKWGRIGI